ncbi:hypothetical protein OG601_47930 [Streptomyces sp. NBC_01239]|uniref:hypothetical protein n=1 Tax=Streptomyces sp. NBC_01239 TaxID=2903792 RepID=UPI002250B236|nr:hypothetical protein [Streptomyces sp. NBC_01239]MCX4818303.1 hypothetical protein [Streptomyces sp. NBC_01239]
MSPPTRSAPPTRPAPPPGPHTRRADLASRAWTEALAMTRPDPDPDPGPGRAPRPCGELAAAALREHSALSAALGRSVPLTALGPGGGGTGALAAFLAVYAAQDESRTASARRREP